MKTMWKAMLIMPMLLIMLVSVGLCQIVINEFSYDDTGTDSVDFIELYNAGASAVDISGYDLVYGNTSENIMTLPASTTLAAGDYYVIGNSGMGLPNVDFSMPFGTIGNSMNFISIRDASDVILDSVVYERNKDDQLIPAGHGEPASDGTTAPAGNSGGFWGNTTLTEADEVDGNGLVTSGDPFASISIGRYVDGLDSDVNVNDFGYQVASPGEANNTYGLINVAAGYYNDFDGMADDTIIAEIPAGRATSAMVQDPTVADTLSSTPGAFNPYAIPASPQGGKCMIFGRTHVSGNTMGGLYNLTESVTDVAFECYVYLDATAEAAGETEHSNIVTVRGHAESPHCDAHGVNDATDGIRWFFVSDETSATLTLEERRNGAAVQTFGTITLTPGVDDGWQRLALEVNGSDVTGVFGGTIGSGATTGQVFTGTTTLTRPGGMGLACREAVADNTTYRPITIDALRISTELDMTPVEQWDKDYR